MQILTVLIVNNSHNNNGKLPFRWTLFGHDDFDDAVGFFFVYHVDFGLFFLGHHFFLLCNHDIYV